MNRRGRPNGRPPGRGNNQNANPSTPSGPTPRRGNPRGGGPPPNRPRHAHAHASVPAFSSLAPGTPVSIVLKQDQPTGHRVRGLVAELLTRGDHPRGVKVRLRDGRVGRVQEIVSEQEGRRGEDAVGGPDAGLGRDGESAGGGGRGRGRGGMMETDVRDDEYFYDEERVGQRDLGYFRELEEADAREAGWSGAERSMVVAGVRSEVVACPVCGVFEGDERAVQHHVEGHFGEST